MRRSRMALLFFLGTFATGLYTADFVPSPRSVAADYGPRGMTGSRLSPADDGERPDWCLPSPAIDALVARRHAPFAAAPKYAPATRKVTGRVKRPAPPASVLETADARAGTAPADLPCSAQQLPWTCPLAQPLTETELERGARPSLAMRTIQAPRAPHPADLPRGEVLRPTEPRVVRGDLTALVRDPRHSTGSALALRLNAERDGLSRRIAAARPRDSYSRRYDYPFDFDCRLQVASGHALAASVECNADDSYAAARALAQTAPCAVEVAGDTGIVREDLLARSPTLAIDLHQMQALLATGTRLTRDWSAAVAEWRDWLVERAATAAAADSARPDATDGESAPVGTKADAAARPATSAGAYLGL